MPPHHSIPPAARPRPETQIVSPGVYHTFSFVVFTSRGEIEKELLYVAPGDVTRAKQVFCLDGVKWSQSAGSQTLTMQHPNLMARKN